MHLRDHGLGPATLLSTPGATLGGIAADLGIVRGTLSEWVRAHGTGKKTAADGRISRQAAEYFAGETNW